MRSSLKSYQKVNRDSSLSAADPHTVILMLFDGILESISVAKGAVSRNDLLMKSKSINKAMSILRSLQDSLDRKTEPQISENFYALYNYCIDRLVDASTSLDVVVFDEVVNLLKPIRDAWKEMPEDGKQEGLVKIQQRDLALKNQAIGL